MTQITAILPDELLISLDSAAAELCLDRAEVIRQAVESYLDDMEDISHTIHAPHDSTDPVLDWEEAKRDLPPFD